jgi:hypothetical protein
VGQEGKFFTSDKVGAGAVWCQGLQNELLSTKLEVEVEEETETAE